MKLPGFSAATKPSGMPISIANNMAANTSCTVGHSRLPSSVVTGSLVLNEVPRSPVTSSLDVAAEALVHGIVEAELLAHALVDLRDRRRARRRRGSRRTSPG